MATMMYNGRVNMFRKIIYGTLGFVIGAIIGLEVSAYIKFFRFTDNLFLSVPPFIFSGFATALGIRLAAQKNLKEKQYEQAVSETNRGDEFVASCIVGIQLLLHLFVILLFVAIVLLLHTSYEDLLNLVRHNYLFVLIVVLMLQIVSSWLGISYVVYKNYLKHFHSIKKILPWAVILWTVMLSFVFGTGTLFKDPLSFIVGLIIYSAQLWYFLNKAHNNLVKVTNVGTSSIIRTNP